MRVKVLFLVLLIAFVGTPRSGYAEKVRTNQRAKVYNRPGEQGKVLVKLKEGQAMTVLAKEGRWLKVRVSGRTGYIPRSKVDMSSDEEIVRNTRRRPFVDGRSKRRGFGGIDGAPEDRIAADALGDLEAGGDEDEDADSGDDEDGEGGDGEASDDDEDEDDEDDEDDDRLRARVSKRTALYDEPDDESDEAYEASPKDVLFVLEQKGKWTLVETEEGDVGYILTDKLELQEAGGKGGKGGRIIDVRGRLGVTIMSQSLTSAGGTAAWPDRYKLGSSAAAVALGGALLYPYKKNFVVGGELTWDIARAVPGISFDPDGAAGPMPSKTTGFTMHNVNVRAVGGYDLKKQNGMIVFARLGYHYESFLVSNVTNLAENNARLPSEVIKGPMIGAALAIPKLTDKIGVRVNADAMVVGASVTQTKNLEDGANPSAKRYTLGGLFSYRWKSGFDLQASYDLNYASVEFGAPIATSMRGHTGTAVSRTDLTHTVAFGLAKAF